MDIRSLLNLEDEKAPVPSSSNASKRRAVQRHDKTPSASDSNQFRPLLPKLEKSPKRKGEIFIASSYSRLMSVPFPSTQSTDEDPLYGVANTCSIHPVSPPIRNPFGPEADALMIFLLERIQIPAKTKALVHALGRAQQGIATRRDVLFRYIPNKDCPSCQVLRRNLDKVRSQYRGADWGITRSFEDGDISVVVPPPTYLRLGETSLPIVLRARLVENNPPVSMVLYYNSAPKMSEEILFTGNRDCVLPRFKLTEPGKHQLILYIGPVSEIVLEFIIICNADHG